MVSLLAIACVERPPTDGSLTMLTYNVAGLPDALTDAQPEVHIPLISPLLDAYDLVLVQEDFVYHDLLVADVHHPFQSTSKEPSDRLLGDGLNRLSRSAFADFERIQWDDCYGGLDYGSSDCLAEKGFTVGRHDLGGADLVVIDLHADAGGQDGDVEARWGNVEQILAFVSSIDADLPLVIAGDTNMSPDDPPDKQQLQRIAEEGLVDACEAFLCDPEAIDRILLRSTPEVHLSVRSHWVPEEFVDPQGAPLSDHEPLAIDLTWERGPAP